MTIKLPTLDGAVELAELTGPGECTGCRRKGGGMMRVDVVGGGDRASIDLCGNCLAEGLAIVLGRRHVQQGGRIEDLRPLDREVARARRDRARRDVEASG